MYYFNIEIEYVATSFSPTRMDLALKLLRIMVLLRTMLPNYSVPCHKGDGGNTLATRYNPKIILVDDTY
jgi:hypothetical protein